MNNILKFIAFSLGAVNAFASINRGQDSDFLMFNSARELSAFLRDSSLENGVSTGRVAINRYGQFIFVPQDVAQSGLIQSITIESQDLSDKLKDIIVPGSGSRDLVIRFVPNSNKLELKIAGRTGPDPIP